MQLPPSWSSLPPMPAKGKTVAMKDKDGFGLQYLAVVDGEAHMVKFLPPFDGRLSVTDTGGRVRVLYSLQELAVLLRYHKSRKAPPKVCDNCTHFDGLCTRLGVKVRPDFYCKDYQSEEAAPKAATQGALA